MGKDRALRVVVTTKRDCLLTLLSTVEEVRDARVRAQADGQSEAGEYLSMKALLDAEEQLLEIILQPAMSELLQEFVDVLGNMAGEAA